MKEAWVIDDSENKVEAKVHEYDTKEDISKSKGAAKDEKMTSMKLSPNTIFVGRRTREGTLNRCTFIANERTKWKRNGNEIETKWKQK